MLETLAFTELSDIQLHGAQKYEIFGTRGGQNWGQVPKSGDIAEAEAIRAL